MPVSLSQVIGVVLVLAVIYYILGLIVSSITKLALEAFDIRGKTLENFLKKNLVGVVEGGKQGLLDKLKEMPQLSSLRPVRYKYFGLGFFLPKDSTKFSDYVEQIPSKNLVDALFDLEGTIKTGNEKVKEVIDILPDKIIGPDGKEITFAAKEKLKKLADNGFDDVEQMRSKMETWFDGIMSQAGQEFRAKARQIVVLISLLVVFILGVDTIDIAQRAWSDASLVKKADVQASIILSSDADQAQKNADIAKLYDTLDDFQVLNIPFWRSAATAPQSNGSIFIRILGMLITTLAVAQGSSFWYDIIRQIKGEQKTAKASPKESETTTITPTSSLGDVGMFGLRSKDMENALKESLKSQSSGDKPEK